MLVKRTSHQIRALKKINVMIAGKKRAAWCKNDAIIFISLLYAVIRAIVAIFTRSDWAIHSIQYTDSVTFLCLNHLQTGIDLLKITNRWDNLIHYSSFDSSVIGFLITTIPSFLRRGNPVRQDHFWIPALRSAVAGMTSLVAGLILPISPLNGRKFQRQLIEYKCNL